MALGRVKLYVLAALCSFISPSITTARPLTKAEIPVCETPTQCLDILERHDVESFDYRVLSAEFSRFGTAGKIALLSALVSKKTELSNRAALLLYVGDFEFTHEELSQIAEHWPNGDPKILSALMTKHYSPPMRDAAILTLSNPDKTISDFSRYILEGGEIKLSKTDRFTPLPKFLDPLKKAALANPSAGLLSLLSTYPYKEIVGIMEQDLKSERVEVIETAYSVLKNHDSENAFRQMSQTIQNLKSGDEKTALSLALFLQDLIGTQSLETDMSLPNRYLEFATNLIVEKDSSPLARMVGVDVIMQLRQKTALPKTPLAAKSLEAALKIYGTVPLSYNQFFFDKISAQAESLLPLLWKSVNFQGSRNKPDFIEGLTNAPMSEPVIKVLLTALTDSSDWKSVSNAAEILGTHRVKLAKSKLLFISETHPILMARASALAALDSIDGQDFQARKIFWLKSLLNTETDCPVTPIDFKKNARQLPFFDATEMAYGQETKRAYLTSSVPTTRGWLAGYSAGQNSGGLIAYDNRTGKGERIYGLSDRGEGYEAFYPPNIFAVLPQTPTPLGQTATTFWAFTALEKSRSLGDILSITDTGSDYKVDRLYRLPMAPNAIDRLKDNSLLIEFGHKDEVENLTDQFGLNYHPPLRLLPDGRVVRGCSELPDLKTKAIP